MKRFLYWTSMVILGAVLGAYGIRETCRGTDLILAGRTAEAREVFLRASRYCHYLEDLVNYCDASEYYDDGDRCAPPQKLTHPLLRDLTRGGAKHSNKKFRRSAKAEQAVRREQGQRAGTMIWPNGSLRTWKNWTGTEKGSAFRHFPPTQPPIRQFGPPTTPGTTAERTRVRRSL